MCHANSFNNTEAKFKSDYILNRHWIQLDDRIAELVARYFKGLYMSREAYFQRPETLSYYTARDLRPQHMTFSIALSEQNRKKYARVAKENNW